jgi:OmpA-OmpF porin, OOP family
MNRRSALALPFLCAVLVLGGCMVPTDSEPQESKPPDCRWLSEEPSGDFDPPTDDRVVLVDRSTSFRSADQHDERARILITQAAAQTVAAYSKEDFRTFSLGLFDGNGNVYWLYTQQHLPQAYGTLRTMDRLRQDAATCVSDKLREALEQAPSRADSDMARALNQAASKVVAGAGDKRIVAIGDGLTNSGCADLGRAELKQRDRLPVQQIFNDCDQQLGHLDLTDVQVEFFWLGDGLGSKVDGDQQTWLNAFWSDFVSHAGGSPNTEAGPGQALPQTATAADGPEDPAVVLPSMKADEPRTVTAKGSVPGDILFATDESTFRPGGEAALLDRISEYEGKKDLKVAVTGHTDERGTKEHNDALSLRRARTVARALRDKAIEVTQVVGRGEEDLLPCSASPSRCWEKDRRVALSMTYTEYAPE